VLDVVLWNAYWIWIVLVPLLPVVYALYAYVQRERHRVLSTDPVMVVDTDQALEYMHTMIASVQYTQYCLDGSDAHTTRTFVLWCCYLYPVWILVNMYSGVHVTVLVVVDGVFLYYSPIGEYIKGHYMASTVTRHTITKPLKSTEHTEQQISIVEHERYWIGLGWKHQFAPGDPFTWTTLDGSISSSSPPEVVLTGQAWAGEWQVEPWMYSDNMWKGQATTPSWMHFTRKRIWTRRFM
jgi:hypothetical protein